MALTNSWAMRCAMSIVSEEGWEDAEEECEGEEEGQVRPRILRMKYFWRTCTDKPEDIVLNKPCVIFIAPPACCRVPANTCLAYNVMATCKSKCNRVSSVRQPHRFSCEYEFHNHTMTRGDQ